MHSCHGRRCTVCCSFLRVEWHLNSLPEEERLGGVALRLGLRHLITRGCGTQQPSHEIVVEDEEYRPINFGKAVPGLLEEHFRHVERKDKLTKGPRVAESGELMHGQLPLGISWNVSTHKRPVEGRTLFTVHDRNGTTTAFQFLG